LRSASPERMRAPPGLAANTKCDLSGIACSARAGSPGSVPAPASGSTTYGHPDRGSRAAATDKPACQSQIEPVLDLFPQYGSCVRNYVGGPMKRPRLDDLRVRLTPAPGPLRQEVEDSSFAGATTSRQCVAAAIKVAIGGANDIPPRPPLTSSSDGCWPTLRRIAPSRANVRRCPASESIRILRGQVPVVEAQLVAVALE
jgi:hypothetical protein